MMTTSELTEIKRAIWRRLLTKSRVEEDCLLWTGGTTGPYGMASISKKSYSVHRISYWIHHTNFDSVSEIPLSNDDGVRLMIRHLCENKLCFKPEHLIIGSQYENDYDDKLRDGTLPTGDKHYNASITIDVARQIKDSLKLRGQEGYRTQKQRAIDFGVTLRVVKSIDQGRSWMELQSDDDKLRRREMARHARKAAKTREWTDDMWEEARKKIRSKSKLSSIANEFIGTPCMLWTAGISKGYAQIAMYGRLFMVHRLVCAIKRKEHPSPDMVARHLCGNSLCVREDHLELGTHQENSLDRIRHKRVGKLTPDQIIEIRETYKNDPKPYVEVAREYDVHATTIGAVLRGVTWMRV